MILPIKEAEGILIGRHKPKGNCFYTWFCIVMAEQMHPFSKRYCVQQKLNASDSNFHDELENRNYQLIL